MNPLLIKLIVALAPCVEQVVATLLEKLEASASSAEAQSR